MNGKTKGYGHEIWKKKPEKEINKKKPTYETFSATNYTKPKTKKTKMATKTTKISMTMMMTTTMMTSKTFLPLCR